MIVPHDELGRAIYIYDADGQIFKQMSFGEFEAVLDGYVPAMDLNPGIWKSVYLEIDDAYCVKRAVFFYLPITQAAAIDGSWSLPLMNLAERSPEKTVGGEPIQIACCSQSPSAHLQNSLWDPSFTAENNQLKRIREEVKKNRIGLQFLTADDDDDDASLSKAQKAQFEREVSERLRKTYSQEARDHIAKVLKGQRFQAKTLKSEYLNKIRTVKVDYEERFEDYRSLLADRARLLDEQKSINSSLKDTVDGQAQKITGIREYFDAKLRESDQDSERSLEVYRDAIFAEVEAKVESDSKDLKETLQMREVELLYRNELEVQLHDEVARLREENHNLLSHTGDKLLQNLNVNGISLVTYQPGAGHITIPVSEVARFLDNPVLYTASQCGVSTDRYAEWLEHYHMPVCKNQHEDGGLCGENLNRIENPLDFTSNKDDVCSSCLKTKKRSHLKVAGS
ncbi:MAG: hypothetical protein ACI93R_001606 [Flavobacteriales bacterium]|jgi:hypothetical protein